MDITFLTEEGKFNYRVAALIIKDGKILIMNDERGKYYYLPGGRVHLNETAECAIKRELKEELQVSSEIVRELWFLQSFFSDEASKYRFHELGLYYLVKLTSPLPSNDEVFVIHEEGHVFEFRWVPLKELASYHFYPEFVTENIFDLPKTLQSIIDIK